MIVKTNNFGKRGKTHNMNYTRFVQQLFELNCTFPPSKKMTDGEIARQLYVEYKHYETFEQRFSKKNPDLALVIAKLRSEYNRGVLIPRLGPPDSKLTSFSYDIQGRPINPKFIQLTPMSPDEIEAAKKKVAARRVKFEAKQPK